MGDDRDLIVVADSEAGPLEYEKYTIRPDVLDPAPQLEISREKFYEVKKARGILNAALAIEEKYELLYCNYVEYEKDLLSGTLENMARFDFGYDKAFNSMTVFNRRIINILTSARMYVDQMVGHLRDCLTEEAEISITIFFKELTSWQYDSKFEYSFMEALRNHAQHAGLCVSRVKSDNRNYEVGDGGLLWENRTLIYCSKELVSQNPKFKSTVYNAMPDEVELTTAIRVYIGSISEIHDSVRRKIQMNVDSARLCMETVLEEYKAVSKNKFRFTHANHFLGGSNSPIEKVLVFLDWDDVRIKLQARNLRRPNLAKHYVSSRTDTNTITPCK